MDPHPEVAAFQALLTPQGAALLARITPYDGARTLAAAEELRRAGVDPGLAAAALSEGASPLTRREQEVLLASREHATVAQVALALHLSPGTTRNHLSAIMGKLGAHSRIEALRIAEERGWL